MAKKSLSAREKIIADHKEVIRGLHRSLRYELLQGNYGFHAALTVKIKQETVIFGTNFKKEENGQDWASDISFYLPEQKDYGSKEIEPAGINFGSIGTIHPSDSSPQGKANVWRTIHAAIILQNFTEINTLCSYYAMKLKREIGEVKEKLSKLEKK